MAMNTLAAARTAANLTQAQLAAAAGVHAKTIANYERDRLDLLQPSYHHNCHATKVIDALARHGVTIKPGAILFREPPAR